MDRVSEDDERVVASSIATELRRILVDAPTLTALRSLELPELDSLLATAGRSRDDLPDLLERAIVGLDDPVYRSAASDLFPLPYGDAGWLKLSARGRKAGERFGISYEGLRKSTDGRPSYVDRVLAQVGEQLVSVVRDCAPTVPGHAAAPTTSPPSPSPSSRSRTRRRLTLVAAAVLVAMAGLAVWLVVRPSSSSSAHGASQFVPKGCKVPIGQLDSVLSKEPDAAATSARLVSLYRTNNKATQLACATGPAYRWQAIAVQELSKNGHSSGALLASPNGVDLYLNNAAWGSYHQIGGKTGDAAQTTAGLPQQVVPFADGHVEISFSAGVVMVAERVDAPYFWIPSAFVTWWRNNQSALGLPTSNPLPTFRQEFQHGYATVDPIQAGVPIITILTHPEAELPALDAIRGHILRQADGTTWFVSADGKREWIPDGPTWTCLGGDSKQVALDLPGYAIASLTLGSQAQCP